MAKTILVKQAESITIVNAIDDKDAEVKVRVTILKSKPSLNRNLIIFSQICYENSDMECDNFVILGENQIERRR